VSAPPENPPEQSIDEPADETTDEPTEHDPPAPTRRERRARHGGESAKVPGPPPGRRYPVPAKPRDYAARRRG